MRARAQDDSDTPMLNLDTLTTAHTHLTVEQQRFDAAIAWATVPELVSIADRTLAMAALARYRTLHGLDQGTVATAMGVTSSHISRYERGLRTPTRRFLADYAQALMANMPLVYENTR